MSWRSLSHLTSLGQGLGNSWDPCGTDSGTAGPSSEAGLVDLLLLIPTSVLEAAVLYGCPGICQSAFETFGRMKLRYPWYN